MLNNETMRVFFTYESLFIQEDMGMSLFSILAIGIGLSSMGCICGQYRKRYDNEERSIFCVMHHAGFFFGVFQAVMPLITGSYFVSSSLPSTTGLGHSAVIIGGNMIRESLRGEEEAQEDKL